MKKVTIQASLLLMLTIAAILGSCNNGESKPDEVDSNAVVQSPQADLIGRGVPVQMICDSFDCNSDSCFARLRKHHEITEDTFRAMRAHIDDLPDSLSLNADSLYHLMGNITCSSHTVCFRDLNFRLEEKKEKYLDPRYYSVSLFKSFFTDDDKPTSFTFYTAKKDTKEDVIFRVYFSKHSEVYDLSGSVPPLERSVVTAK